MQNPLESPKADDRKQYSMPKEALGQGQAGEGQNRHKQELGQEPISEDQNIQYSFFAFLSRMRQISRWSLMRNTVPENVQEHSHQVAVLAHALALIRNRLFGGKLNAERLALLGLYHDASETLTGDLPTPIKYFSPEIHSAYRDLEQVAKNRIIAMLPDFLKEEYADLFFDSHQGQAGQEAAAGQPEQPCTQCDDEMNILKAADRLAALLKCIEEEKNGNREFQKAKVAIELRLMEMCGKDGACMPEIKYFLDHFARSFEKTLDELS